MAQDKKIGEILKAMEDEAVAKNKVTNGFNEFSLLGGSKNGLVRSYFRTGG